jgi:hypothetical protein
MDEYDEVEQIEQEHMMMVMKEVEMLMVQHVIDSMVLMEKEHMLMMISYKMVVVVVEKNQFHCC